MKTTKTILTKIVHILIVIFTGNTQASFTETVAEGTTVSGEIVAPKEWDGLNRNHQRVFGTVTDTILRGDSQTSPNWAQQDVFRGGYTNNITVENTGNQSIFGGTAENTVIKDEGRATLKNQGIFKEGKVYKGGFFSAQSGTVDNINVYENGQFDISGNDDGVIVEGGEITYLAKGSIFQGRAKINNLKISGNVVVSDNGSKYSPDFSRANIKPGGLLRLSTGRMINSSVKEGSLSVFKAGSEASDTTMKGGRIEVGEGGILKRTQMTGGSLDVKEGGLAEATFVNGGGRMLNDSGTDIGTVVNSGTYTLDAHSTTAQSNNLTLGNEATAYIRKGTVNGANVDNGQMIFGFQRLSSTLKGDVTVGESGQLNVINNGELDTHEANLNLSGRVNLDNDPDPGKVSRFRKVSMNQGHFYFDYSISGGFSKNYSILFLQTLSGTGTFWMNTDIAGHRGDFLHVRGEANGHFGVMVTDSGESPKAEDSLKIIQTGGGNAEFYLDNPEKVVDVGTYQYHLVPDDHKRGWSLVSHQPQPSEKPQTGSESNPEAPVTPSVPEEKEAVLTPVSGETVAPAVIDETQTRKLAPKAPELKPAVSEHREIEMAQIPEQKVYDKVKAPPVSSEDQNPKVNRPFTEEVVAGTTVSGEIVAPKEWDGLNRNHQRVFGTVTDTILRGDSQTSPNWAQQDVFRGGYTNNITVENTGNQSIFGGTAENTVIKDEGRATLKNQGIFKEGKVYKGGFFSAQSGTVDNINVYENGQFDISGNDDGVIVEGGEITYLAKGSIFQGRAKINNLKISGNVVVSDNGSKYSPDFSRANIKPGGLLRLSTGRMINSSVKEGSLSVFKAGSEASDTTMKGGRIEVGEGGILKRTQMTGGSLDVKEGGLAEATFVNGGGRMLNDSGTDIGTVVNSGTYTLDAHSTTAQSNNLTLGNEATAYIRKGTVNGANVDNGQMIFGFQRLSSTLKGDVTVGESGQLNVINNGELDTHEANLNLSGRVNLDNDPDPGKVSRFRKVSMNQGHFYFDYSISGGFSKNYSILFLQTLSGTGTFWMNTDIAGHRGDFLHVRGEANGHFGVMVTDSGESPKAEDSLKIIQTGGGNAEFYLDNPEKVVDVGTYQYHLVPDDHKRGWSLVSHQPQPSEKPQTGSESNPEAPVTPSVPEEKEAVLTPVSGETVAPAVIDETQTRKLAPKAPELKPAVSEHREIEMAQIPEQKVYDKVKAPPVSSEDQNPKVNRPFTEEVVAGTTVSGEIVAPKEWDGLNRNHQRVFGTVTDTILRGDSQTSPNWAQQDVFRGGYTNNITVENTGNQSIFGGTAENTVIKDEGRATLKNQGIFKEGKVYKGGFFSAQSGTVDNINVYENGQFDISGNDDGVIVEGGEITYLAKGSIFQGRAKINNLKISGNVVVSDNGSKYSPDFSRANIKPGGLLRLSTGRMINSSVKEGSLSVFKAGSEASDTTMKGGRIEVGEGGILKRTQMTGGSLDVKEGGLAEATFVNGGGRMLNDSGTDIGTVVNSGTYTLDAHSTTAQSDNLTLEKDATAYIRKGILNGATLNGGLMILVDDGLSSTLKGNVTVGELGQLDVINSGRLDTHEANLNLSGRVRLKKDADFGTVLMNNGHFYFDSDSNEKLSVETLSGTGTFWMNTDIAGHRGDFLHVRGEANGHFGVMVTDSGESPKAEDSLKIIQTGGGNAEFNLANPRKVVDVGTYQYHLVPDDLKRAWSLVSHQPQPSEKPQPGSEAPVPPSAPKEKEAVLTPVSGETVAPAVTDETQTGKLAPPELKPEAPVTPSVEKEGEKKVAPNRLLSPPKNVSRTNRAPDIPSITPSTAAVLSMSTVGPLIYHSEMAQIQERMSDTRQTKTEDTVWVKLMNERQNISQKAGDGYGLKLNGLSVGADCTIRLGRGYTTRGVFFTHSDDKVNFRGKAIGGGRVRSWSAGTYAAYYHDSGFWLDGILKANRFSQEIYGKMTGGGDAFGDFSTLALGASIRGGKDMVAGEMTFTPYLSLSGLRTTRSSLSLSNGMKGDISAQRSVLGKVGLRALYQTRIKEVSVTPWIDVGVEREFIKNNRVRINQLDSFDNDLSGITGAYSLGLSANISQTWNISATAGYKKGKHLESPWNASLGMSGKF